MRTIPACIAALGLLSVGLAGCSVPGTQGCPAPDADGPEALETVTVTGSTEAPPEVEVYLPFHASSAAFEEVVIGDGTPITTDTQLIMMDVSVTSGETGETLVETAYDGDESGVSTVSQWTEAIPGFADALLCAAEGSRVVVALPPGSITEATAASIELGADDTGIAVMDVRRVYLPKADGANQFNVGTGLPTVVRAPDGRPGIIVPDAAPPTDVAVQTIKRGTGPVVTGDEPVRVHYTGLTWADRTVFETTWDGAPQSIDLETMLPGFADALSGQTVGSQVMVVIPPDEGYGDVEQGAIPANSTLVFVVDILGLDQVPAD